MAEKNGKGKQGEKAVEAAPAPSGAAVEGGVVETASAGPTVTGGEPVMTEDDDFLPEGEWREVSSTGAPVYRPEAGLADKIALRGVPYDVILALGGAEEAGGVWEAIVFHATAPTVGFRKDERVDVNIGEDILMPANALLRGIALKAISEKVLQEAKLLPLGLRDHATKKNQEFWEYRIGVGPMISRDSKLLYRQPERWDVYEHIAKKIAELKAKQEGPAQAFKRMIEIASARLAKAVQDGQQPPSDMLKAMRAVPGFTVPVQATQLQA